MRPFDATERLSRFAALILFVAAFAVASGSAAMDDEARWEAEAAVLATTADVARGGGEIAAHDEASYTEAGRTTAPESDAAFSGSTRTRGGRSCSTLVLQNDE